jgi:hypothetical protein
MDSVENMSASSGHNNCYTGATDGRFVANQPWYDNSLHCLAHNHPPSFPSDLWLNIQFPRPAKISSVFIINREDGWDYRIIGFDLYVGNNPLPKLNVACGANPMSSGVYSCGGKLGNYLGIYRPAASDYLNINQIRAYSYEANAAPFTYSTTTPVDCLASTLAFVNGKIYDNTAGINPCLTQLQKLEKNSITGAPSCYQVSFSQARFVHIVTLVGTYSQTTSNY